MNPILSEIDEMMTFHSDSALVLLETMYSDRTFDKQNQAYYYILLTEAKNRNVESLLSCDSLIDISIKRLGNDRNKELPARAWMCKGRIWRELKEPEKAIQSFHHALHLLNNQSKYNKSRSKIYHSFGQIYLEQLLFEDALKMFNDSYTLYLEAGNKWDMTLVLNDIGTTYFFLQQPNNAFSYLQEALETAGQSEDSIFLKDIIHNTLSLYYSKTGRHEQALQQLQKITRPTDHNYLGKSSIFMNLQQPDSAKRYLQLIDENANIYIQSSKNNYLSQLAVDKGNYAEAYQWQKKYMDCLNSIEVEDRSTEIQIISHKYDVQIATEEMRMKYRTQIAVTLFLSIMALFITIFYFVVRNKNQKIKQKVADTLSAYQMECVSFQSTVSYRQIQQLAEQAPKDRKCFTQEEQKQLQSDIINSFQQLTSDLQAYCTYLTNDDMLFCCLSKTNFSLSVLCFCMGNMDAKAIRQRKSRIKTKMSKAHCDTLFAYFFGFK